MRLEELEKKAQRRAQARQAKRPKMKVSGKSVIKLKDIILKKSKAK